MPCSDEAAAQAGGLADAADANPMGLAGFAFVEFTDPEPKRLGALFAQLGFVHVATHRDGGIRHYAQGDIHFLLNLEVEGPAARFRERHGPSASAMAFRVRDAARARDLALLRGAHALAGTDGTLAAALPAIRGIGGAPLYFLEGEVERALAALGFVPVAGAAPADRSVGLSTIDHLTHNLRRGQMAAWADFYARVFGFREIRHFDIRGARTGLMSKAMVAPDGKIRIPLNESQDDSSQIEEFLRAYNGEGIQHVALRTDDICATVDRLRANGVRFQETPDSYYDRIDSRLPGHGTDIAALRARGILIDGAPEAGGGLLLQIFTRPMIGPIFFEIIERRGCEGFGEGNFQALFESLERDQIRRGTLKVENAAA